MVAKPGGLPIDRSSDGYAYLGNPGPLMLLPLPGDYDVRAPLRQRIIGATVCRLFGHRFLTGSVLFWSWSSGFCTRCWGKPFRPDFKKGEK